MVEEKHDATLLLKRVVNRLGHPFGVNPFPRAFSNPLAEGRGKADVFNEIHRANYWGSTESLSGVGSENSFVAKYCSGLAPLLKRHGITRVFDAPCGDLNWMAEFVRKADIDYIGGDISRAIVDKSRGIYPHLDLRIFDITNDEFPPADVWHCRDCLFHLPYDDIQRALANFARSGIPYALITTHKSRFLHRNLDVGVGGFRLLDLERSPISLPSPVERISDFQWGRDFPRYVGLWTRQQIADAVARWRA